jgi:adenylate cyclase class 2
MANEYEVKFLNIEKDVIRGSLKKLGYKLTKPEVMMRRQTYHLPKDHPEYEFKWGRVRFEGDKVTATIKWYEDPDNLSISNIHEEEVDVDSWEDGVEWITSKGFTKTAYQENYREAWEQNNVEIAIDTWPGLNTYIEIEAPSVDEVKNACDQLGYDIDKGIVGGTEVVYELELGIEKGVIKKLTKITFEEPPRKSE